MLRQIAAVTWLNLSNLRSRLAASTIIVVGIAGVVAVLLGLLAMSTGFRTALVETARPGRVLIMRDGSPNEMSGWVAAEQLAILETLEGLDLVSGEIVVTLGVKERETGEPTDAPVRGVTDAAFGLRPEVQIIAGRAFTPGTGEVIVGVRAAAQYAGLEIGDTVRARRTTFRVVGHFAAAGTAVDSELWIDLPIVQDVFRRPGGVSVVRARLHPAAKAEEVRERIVADPRLPLSLVAETDFFHEQSAARAALIDTFAYLVAGIMGLGSVMAALNTMYTAVSRRTVEIATLRALGFGNAGVVTSVIVESMLLALLGGLIGALLVYTSLNGYATSTFNNASATQVAFAFQVTPALITTSLLWALGLGFVGGLLPALKAARLPVTQALRGV